MSSSDLAISVYGLGKSYTIAHDRERPTNFREAIIDRLRHPLGHGRQEKETFWALKDVDLDVRRGEIVGIIGRNGAGKSTLLKLLSRITGPTAGGIDLYGRVASLLEVGTGFHPELTGRENIFLNGSVMGMRRREIDRKFDEIVAFSEVEKFLDTPVKRYSSGMYIRLAFAVAAHLEPEILIVDEVLAVGDASFQRKCLGKMRDVTRSGERTVLFVSHNLTTIRSLCDRAVWLKAGRIAWDGPVGPAIESYLTEDLGGASNAFDVDRLDRPHVRETPIRLSRVVFNNGEPVRHGEPLQIDIDYKVGRRTEGVAFAIAFRGIEGGRIMSADTAVPGGRHLDLEPGSTGRVRLSIAECQIQPERYYIDVRVRTGNISLDLLRSFAQIEVVPGDKTPAFIVGRNDGGCVWAPAALTVHDGPAEPPVRFETQESLT